MRNRILLWSATAGVAGLVSSVTAFGGLNETRSNYVGSNWGDSWKEIKNWAALPSYSAEPGDGGGDINYISMAHDDSNLYINFNQASQFTYDYGNQEISFDTDLNASTGNTTDFWWWGTSTGVGAEHTMYGPALWHYPDTSWGGDTVNDWVYYGTETGDVLIKIALSKLGTPSAFNFVGRMFGTDDYYPNAGLFDRYNVTTPTGTTINWNTATGSYATAGNWTGGVAPTMADNVVIANGGTAAVDTSAVNGAKVFSLDIGSGSGNGTLNVVAGGDLFVENIMRLGSGTSTGTVNQSGGQVRIDYGGTVDLRIGFDAGGTGVYNLSGGELAVGDSFTIGHFGTGTFNMTGGTVSKAGFITVGNNPGSNGTFTMSAGTVNQSFGNFEIGDEGVGNVTISGGTFNVAPGWNMQIGNRRGGNGTATISGTALVHANAVIVGGALDEVQVGTSSTQGIGTLNIDGGELQDEDDFIVGHFGAGTVTMTNGLVSKAGWIVLGDEVGSTGTFNMSGGTITQTFGELQVGDAGTGTMNLSGGSVAISSNILIANQAGSTGALHVSGGTLTGTTMVNNGTFTYTGGSVSVGAVDGGGNTTVGSGAQLNVAHVRQNSLTVSGNAQVTIAPTGGGLANGTSVVNSVAINTGGRLDIGDNKLIVKSGGVGSWNGSAYTGVTGLVASGYSPNQDFSGSGIVTTQSNATGGNTLTNIGVVSNADLGLSTFGGQSVGPNDTLVMYTYGGDANLDGAITGDDYFQIDSGFPAGAHGWFNGDFNYDGAITGDDYFVIDSNFSAQGAPFPTSGAALAGVTAVPEPASISFMAAATAAWAMRGSRRRRRADRRQR